VMNFIQPNKPAYLDESRVYRSEGLVVQIRDNTVTGYVRYVYRPDIDVVVDVYVGNFKVASGVSNINLSNINVPESFISKCFQIEIPKQYILHEDVPLIVIPSLDPYPLGFQPKY